MKILISRICLRNPLFRLCSTASQPAVRSIQEVNPEDAKVLENYSINYGEKTISMLNYYSRIYKKHTYFNKMLFDPQIAKEIKEKIQETSDGDDETPIIDIDGGLSLVLRSFSRQRSSSHRPLISCGKTGPVAKFMKDFLRSRKKIQVLHFNMADELLSLIYEKERHDLLLTDILSNNAGGWENAKPNVTFLGTPSMTICRFLALECLKSLQKSSSACSFGIFSDCRPEFYLMVDHRV